MTYEKMWNELHDWMEEMLDEANRNFSTSEDELRLMWDVIGKMEELKYNNLLDNSK